MVARSLARWGAIGAAARLVLAEVELTREAKSFVLSVCFEIRLGPSGSGCSGGGSSSSSGSSGGVSGTGGGGGPMRVALLGGGNLKVSPRSI